MHVLQQFLAFSETAKHGSFSAAARELGTAPSSLAKAVGRLEVTLGVKLFHRTTRQVSLTSDGERLFHRCQRVLTEVDELRAEAAGTRSAPTGTLRIDMPSFYGKRIALPRLAELTLRHPGLQLDVRLHDAHVDLARDGIDLAVRIGALQDSTLVARRIDSQELVLCASAQYLQVRGVPRRVEELAAHSAIVFRMPGSGRNRPWQFRQRGNTVELHPISQVRVNDTEGLLEAVKLGLGVCQLPDYLLSEELASGELVELLPSCRPEPLPISLVYPSGRLLPKRVRAAIEVLESLGQRRLASPPCT